MKNIRLKKLIDLVSKSEFDAYLVLGTRHLRYLLGNWIDDGFLWIESEWALLCCDKRCDGRAYQSNELSVEVVDGPDKKRILLDSFNRLKSKKIGIAVDGEDSLAFLQILIGNGAEFDWNRKTDFIMQLRIIKDKGEIALIKEACSITRQVLHEISNEIKDREVFDSLGLYQDMLCKAVNLGADCFSFKPIIVQAPESCMPHATFFQRKLKPNKGLLIDVGIVYRDYCSDLTRMIEWGRMPPELEKAFEVVCKAQKAAIDIIKPGMPVSLVNEAAKSVIENAGYEECWLHATGHGVGLTVHELPSISDMDKTKLLPGMTLTIEPGLYLNGIGGVRQEDVVLVTESGCKILSS